MRPSASRASGMKKPPTKGRCVRGGFSAGLELIQPHPAILFVPQRNNAGAKSEARTVLFKTARTDQFSSWELIEIDLLAICQDAANHDRELRPLNFVLSAADRAFKQRPVLAILQGEGRPPRRVAALDDLKGFLSPAQPAFFSASFFACCTSHQL